MKKKEREQRKLYEKLGDNFYFDKNYANGMMVEFIKEYVNLEALQLDEIDRQVVSTINLANKYHSEYVKDDLFIYWLLYELKLQINKYFSPTEINDDIFFPSLKRIRVAEKRAKIQEIFLSEDGELIPLSEIAEIVGISEEAAKNFMIEVKAESSFLQGKI